MDKMGLHCLPCTPKGMLAWSVEVPLQELHLPPFDGASATVWDINLIIQRP